MNPASLSFIHSGTASIPYEGLVATEVEYVLEVDDDDEEDDER